MGARGIFFIGLFGVCSLWALSEPFAGIVAYVIYYNTAPEQTWWGAALASAGVRYSVIITLALAVGTVLNLKRLPYGPLLDGQEKLYLALLAWAIALGLVLPMEAAEFKGVALNVTVPVEKMLKLTPFLLALTHVIVTKKRFNQFMWLMLACGLYLGYECLTTPAGNYTNGRLEGVGPADARDSNMLAAHLVVFLPIIGVCFLQSRWWVRALCVVAGGLVANGMVLTRSRGGYLAILAGMISGLVLMPKAQWKRVLPLIVLGGVGAAVLVDDKFIERMGTLEAEERNEDESAQSRLRVWNGGLRMSADHPLGVGPGNFHARIGDYLPGDSGRDPHNTYVRCLAELGGPGLVLFVAMIVNAFLTLRRIRRSARERPELESIALVGLALQVSLISYLVASFFITTLYIEMVWWLLMLPSALERATANELCAAGATSDGRVGVSGTWAGMGPTMRSLATVIFP